MMNVSRRFLALVRPAGGLLLMLLIPAEAGAQGSLTPPGAPGPTMKTLEQIEPRIPISSLPFVITNAGSYYVTTNLTGQPGISISASGVTVDLMGFELVGGGGAGVGVSSGQSNVCVRNGTIRNWAGNGVSASGLFNGRFEGLRLIGNRNLAGIAVGRGCIVDRCIAVGNLDRGIEAEMDSLITHCVAAQNGVGIDVSRGSRVRDCTSVSNSFVGIAADFGSTIMDCTVRANVEDGLWVANNCRVVQNHCYTNGTAATGGAGIRVTGFENVIEGNSVIDNRRGIYIERIDGRNLVIRNVARDNFLTGVGNRNYDIATGNRVAQTVIIPFNGVALAGETGGNASGTTDPWSNLSY